MDGTILGYSEASGEGAIRTESGERFTFTQADWKGERPPKAGDKVDFVGAEGKASEIYLLKGSFNAPDLSGIGDKLGDSIGSSESRAEMLNKVQSSEAFGLLMAKPHALGAVLILLGWLLAGHLLLVFSVFDAMDAMDRFNNLASLMGGDSGIGLFRTLGVLSLLLFYLIPIGAGLLLHKAWHGNETGKDKRRGAIAGLVLPIAVPFIAFVFIMLGLPGPIRDMVFEGAGQAADSGMTLGDLIDVDLPWALMIAGGVLILLQMMGIVKSFGNKA